METNKKKIEGCSRICITHSTITDRVFTKYKTKIGYLVISVYMAKMAPNRPLKCVSPYSSV